MNIAQRDRILERVNQVIGRKESVVPNTPECNSHDRLLRISAGLLHLLNEVLPGIANTAERDEIAVWVDVMYCITLIETQNTEARHDTALPLLSPSCDPARAAFLAAELQRLWEVHLDARMRAADPYDGARLWSLIHELRCTTLRIESRYNCLLLKLEGMANITTPSELRESVIPSTLETFPSGQEVRHE
ncbi:hypothetical protein ACN47H_23845 [Klebsiella quasipneumoniae]|uniref:hypothetical protein n=1 Tax=Klebsiella pneumoniae complex TaxID=3390273 RepID=UPI0010F1B0A8|nr:MULTISPECIES: hypothetical protein [Klebsiella]MCH6141621.1 hypothetical protein [Klebsiella variicola]MCH6176575.1 hypothetical protein [Klebsiella variicola]VGC84093.1 Uncharacterised protein [Klebsiella quasipneumoniae]